MSWLLFVVGIIGWHIGLYGMFKKAGIDAWKAFIPFYNTWLIVEKCKLKKGWFWLQLIPIAGQFITIWITIIFVMHFGKFNVIHHTLVVCLPFVYFPYLGFAKEVKFMGEKGFKLYKKPVSREWVDAAAFAVVAATIIRTFVFEAYVIPTGSMEKTLQVHDFLFVSKMTYGARIPTTPLSFPFVHNTMPMSETTPSYLKWLQLPYKRTIGFKEVQRNDVVVFNFPEGDTIINLPGYGSARPYYDFVRASGREAVMNEYGDNILVHPFDKTDNYIKRCVAVGGNTIEIKDGILFVNGVRNYIAPGSQRTYKVKTSKPLDFDLIRTQYGIDIRTDDKRDDFNTQKQTEYRQTGFYFLPLTETDVAALKNIEGVTAIEPYIYQKSMGDQTLFPYTEQAKSWSVDNFGPLYIPKKGATIALTAANISGYRRLITVYEGHTLEEKGNEFIIDGKSTNQYTFKYNYYWMMGDNRHNSQDSRFWGFVPETHIVGSASLIWFSWEGGPRWKRMFSTIK